MAEPLGKTSWWMWQTIDWLAKQLLPTNFRFVVFHYRGQESEILIFVVFLQLGLAILASFGQRELSGKVYKYIGTAVFSSCFEYGHDTWSYNSHLETE